MYIFPKHISLSSPAANVHQINRCSLAVDLRLGTYILFAAIIALLILLMPTLTARLKCIHKPTLVRSQACQHVSPGMLEHYFLSRKHEATNCPALRHRWKPLSRPSDVFFNPFFSLFAGKAGGISLNGFSYSLVSSWLRGEQCTS